MKNPIFAIRENNTVYYYNTGLDHFSTFSIVYKGYHCHMISQDIANWLKLGRIPAFNPKQQVKPKSCKDFHFNLRQFADQYTRLRPLDPFAIKACQMIRD